MNKEKDGKEENSETSELSNDEFDIVLEVEDEASRTISTLENNLETLQDQHLRLQAEFDNYRKRMNARHEEITRFASEGIILKMLDIVDNIERALEVDFKTDPASAKEGINGIYRQLEKVLTNEQVKPIDSLGKIFDPYYQNSIQTVTDESLPDGVVVQEFQKGYMIRDKVLRPAVVSVNRHIDAESVPAREVETEAFTNETEKDEKKGDN